MSVFGDLPEGHRQADDQQGEGNQIWDEHGWRNSASPDRRISVLSVVDPPSEKIWCILSCFRCVQNAGTCYVGSPDVEHGGGLL